MQCLLCNRPLRVRVTIKQLLWPIPIAPPVICQSCRASFKRLSGTPLCPVCGRQQKSAVVCRDCRYWREKYPWQIHHHALFRYNDAMKDFMQRYKFAGDYRLRQVFASEFTMAVAALATDLVIPIPVTEQTMLSRGFNQVSGLVESPLAPWLATRQREKVAQSKKSRHDRLRTKQPFKLTEQAAVKGRQVLLVDDVYTTGRTLYHAANLLYQAGASSVETLSLAR